MPRSVVYCYCIALFWGHNWGSEHDPDTQECSPTSSGGGKYIMYTYSVSGIDSNNRVSQSLLLVTKPNWVM